VRAGDGVILDGTIVPASWCREEAVSVNGEDIEYL
jgi:hypothetical protein